MGWLRDVVSAVRSRLGRRRRLPVPPEQPRSVEEVVARLREIDRSLPESDGVRAFNHMYLQVTELVRDRLSTGFFHDAAFLARLDAVFAGLYLGQVNASPAPLAKAWAPLVEGRAASCLPIQFALAGMNAHINHDLPIAVVRTCRQLGLTPSSPGVKEDYDAITGLLEDVQEQVRQAFLHGVALEADRALAPVIAMVGNWSIAKAREAAWVTAGLLWEIDGVEPLASDYLATLGRSVGLAGRLLLTPVGEPKPGAGPRLPPQNDGLSSLSRE